MEKAIKMILGGLIGIAVILPVIANVKGDAADDIVKNSAVSYQYFNNNDDLSATTDVAVAEAYNQDEKKRKKELKIRRERELAQKEEEELLNNRIYANYRSALAENNDTVGWIDIAALNISYPIVYSNDGDFYMKRNFKGEIDKNGAINLDSSSEGQWSNVNLINGHNMKSGKMFGRLNYLKGEKYCSSHRDFTIARDGEIAIYRIFSVFLTDSSSEEIIFEQKDNKKDYKSFITKLINRSMFPLEITGEINDVVILNTCTYEYTNGHLLICAYKLES